MQTSRLAQMISYEFSNRLAGRANRWTKEAVYPGADLTTAQSLLLALFYCLLDGDNSSVHVLLSIAQRLEQLQSPSLVVWLREDFHFLQYDVAAVLTKLKGFVLETDVVVPLYIIHIFNGLNNKYALSHFLHEADVKECKPVLSYLHTQEQLQQQELPVVFASSLSMESLPCETALEFSPEGKDESTRAHTVTFFAEIFNPPHATKQEFGSVQQETTEPIYENIPAYQEPGRIGLPETTEPIYENIPAYQKKTSGSRKRSVIPKGEAEKMLWKAVVDGNISRAKEALALGAKANMADSLGRTPLHLAVLNGHESVVELLLIGGAGTDRQDSLGRTPLHYTALKGHRYIARLLLEHGADVNLRDNSAMTPTSLAVVKNRNSLAALFKSRGGQECCLC